MNNMQGILNAFSDAGKNMLQKYPNHDLTNVNRDVRTITMKWGDVEERYVHVASYLYL